MSLVSLAWLLCVLLLVTIIWWRFTRAAYLYPTLGRRIYGAVRSSRAPPEAERRAEELLRSVLTEGEYRRLAQRGYLEVRSPRFPWRVYLVPETPGPVTVCERGRPCMRLCVQPVERLPDADVIAMHKLMIEGNELEYLRIANRV